MTTTTKKTADEAGVTDFLHDAGAKLNELKDETVQTLDQRIDALGKAMKKHPILAVGIGVGAGYLLARLLHRS